MARNCLKGENKKPLPICAKQNKRAGDRRSGGNFLWSEESHYCFQSSTISEDLSGGGI